VSELDSEDALRSRVLDLEKSLTAAREALALITSERDRLRRAYALLKEHYELLRRQIFAARAERVDATQLELDFAETKARLEAMATLLEEAAADAPDAAIGPDPAAEASEASSDAAPPPSGAAPPATKPKGRRNLRDEDLPEVRIELTDPELEGIAERIGFESTYKLGYRRAGPVRIVVACATYKTTTSEDDEAEFTTVPMPKEMVDRGLLAPSVIARILTSKYCFGIPFNRLAKMFRAEGVKVDDSMMCRYAEHVGATLGCIVDACAADAKENAFCLSTDATGVAIQPAAIPGRPRQACSKGHFFVVLADRDHIFFEYQREHTSAAVCKMFKGFKGYIQADAHAVYNALYRGEANESPDEKCPEEVGCWSHCRRRFWEAAVVAKSRVALEALLRIRQFFEFEKSWAALPPKQRHEKRQRILRPMIDDFFRWAEEEFARVKGVRGLVATAFGYATRQSDALRRFLDDARLPMTNNHSERALRPIAAGRHAWLFFGSDDHASAAANLFSLIAACQLHGLDVELYLTEMIRIVPLWPRDRYLELAPKYWVHTRSRLDPRELARELGPISVPPRAPAEQPPAN